MSHDQRPARVKVVAGGGGDGAGAKRAGDVTPAALTDVVQATPAATARAPVAFLSTLFIVASITGGIVVALAPMLSGK